MKTAICLSALLALSTSLVADVIIYTGTGKYSSASEQGTLTIPAKVTTITDTNTLETNLVFALSIKVGNRKVKATMTPNLSTLGRADVKKGKAVYANFASASGNRTDANTFSANFARIFGKVSSLVVRPEADPLAFPKTMTGSITRVSGLQVGTNDTMETSSVTLRFSAPQTISANSENLSLGDATNKVRQAYRDAGYEGGF